MNISMFAFVVAAFGQNMRIKHGRADVFSAKEFLEGQVLLGTRSDRWKNGLEYPAVPATLHLLLPAFQRFSLTDRSIDKPAEMAELKFPGWTLTFLLDRAFSQSPAEPLPLTWRTAVS